MTMKPNEYRMYHLLDGEPCRLTYNDVSTKNPSGFPTTYFAPEIMDDGVEAFILFEMCNLCNTRGEARRLLKQGGGYKHIHGTKQPVEFQAIKGAKEKITTSDFENNFLYLRAGKKKLHRLELL